MADSEDIRWRQRLDNLNQATAQFEAACSLESYSDLERAGLIQVFQFTYELAWKTLKDLLTFEGFSVNSPREVIRQGFESGYFDESDAESLLDALKKRNLLAHTYHEETAREAEHLIKERYALALRRLHETLRRKQSA